MATQARIAAPAVEHDELFLTDAEFLARLGMPAGCRVEAVINDLSDATLLSAARH